MKLIDAAEIDVPITSLPFPFLKMGQSRPLFCLFLFLSRCNFNTNWKKHRWCATDSNLGPQDGRRRRNHGAMAATLPYPITLLCSVIFNHTRRCSHRLGTSRGTPRPRPKLTSHQWDQIERFIGLWATY